MKKLSNILSFINKIFREETNKILLGRWSVSYCPISIKKKIDSGNNDHCGTCSFEKIQQKYDDEDDNNEKILKHNEKILK
jgi:hypothetical protein